MFYRLIRSATVRQVSDMPQIAQYCQRIDTALRELGIQAQVGQQVFGDRPRIVWTLEAPTLQLLQDQRQRLAQSTQFSAVLEQGRNFFVEGKLHDALVEVWSDQQQQPSVSSIGGTTGQQQQPQQTQQFQSPYSGTTRP